MLKDVDFKNHLDLILFLFATSELEISYAICRIVSQYSLLLKKMQSMMADYF